MTPSELARKVRYIQLHTRRAVNDLLAGEYISAFKGTGMEFEEVREYQPGDDVKSIDWNVTAKQGRPYIKRFREERELTVNFEGREAVYDVSELDELVLAYATTIHKAQGSEYPVVVMPFMMSHYIMLQRNLLYTGVTRAKKILVMVGQRKAIHYAIHNDEAVKRNTRLAERLREAVS